MSSAQDTSAAATAGGPVPPSLTDLQLLSSNLRQLVNEPRMSDVTFRCGKSRQPVHACRALLAVRSPVFRAMFFGGIPEAGDVTLDDVEAEDLLVALAYMYAGELSLDGNNVMSVLYVAKKYQVTGLQHACVQFVKERLTPADACQLLQRTMLLEDDELRRGVLEYVAQNARAVFECDEFALLGAEIVSQIVSLDELYCDEVPLACECLVGACGG